MNDDDRTVPDPADTPPGSEDASVEMPAPAEDWRPPSPGAAAAEPAESAPRRRGLSRRGLFAGAAGTAVAGALVGAGVTAGAYSSGGGPRPRKPTRST